jgi:Domain of unknown function (DUF4279)
VWFIVSSDIFDHTQLTERIGIEPDRVKVRGSRHNHTDKPVPRHHAWQLICDEPGVAVDAQIDQLLTRLEPARKSLHELTHGGHDVRITLHVGRHFGDEEGQEEVGLVVGNGGKTVREGVSLFGWHLDLPVLEFLVHLGAELDVDEYDLLQNEENFNWPDSDDAKQDEASPQAG